jgi:hypothetical protein
MAKKKPSKKNEQPELPLDAAPEAQAAASDKGQVASDKTDTPAADPSNLKSEISNVV